eukprot:SAG31_NODE_8637_length_1416_cov_1.896735_2_plen_41_part_01
MARAIRCWQSSCTDGALLPCSAKADLQHVYLDCDNVAGGPY